MAEKNKETVLSWKCLNRECQKVFHLTGRVQTRPSPQTQSFCVDPVVSVEKPCCPFCLSLDFEPVRFQVKSAEETK